MIWCNRYAEEWVRRFALLPTELAGGRTVWLGWYEERYVPIAGCASICGRWERQPVTAASKGVQR